MAKGEEKEGRVRDLPRYLREPEVVELTGLAAITLFKMEKRGEFPPRRQLTRRAVGWLEEEVRAWLESRPVAPSMEAGVEAGEEVEA